VGGQLHDPAALTSVLIPDTHRIGGLGYKVIIRYYYYVYYVYLTMHYESLKLRTFERRMILNDYLR